MGFRSLFHRLFGGTPAPREVAPASEFDDIEETFLRMMPPDDVHPVAAWDDYWRAHLEMKLMATHILDHVAATERLVPLLHERGVRRILCVGNGLALEPFRLADDGFKVDALDISTLPESMFAAEAVPP